ncbi:beta-galactosidase [Luteimicrobium album]|uniref:Beta-galactosidase n=1 Tax=Luteimicrobium album TaxID=1054550 RepID=A0ABQ6HYX5_9MICO|nr:beta-galactosidase [Luteimicrobium album]GMA23661.1 beta-galactosidase [Luteimicrobium album]
MAGARWNPERIAYGGDWSPEQWPEADWPAQLTALRDAGITTVTLGVFAWARLQPHPDVWDFAWFDRALDLLHREGFDVVLATPTASPPVWFSRAHPSSRVVDRDGVRLELGSRQNWCPSSPDYRRHASEVTRRLAERYADHPAVVLWHVNNELGCHNAECFCEVSAEAFRTWLRGRHETIDELNRAWGTAFWSQRYGSFDEIGAPARSTTFLNPAQVLDWRRFCSHELRRVLQLERDTLRSAGAKAPVTTNFMMGMGHAPGALDYHQWAQDVDVVSNDHYEVGWGDDEARLHEQVAWAGDLSRGVAEGRPWFLMEHAPSGVNWQRVNRSRRPGELRLATLGHVARGADAACFFQLVQSVAGAEKFHSAVIPHAGTQSRTYREASALGRELATLSEVVGSTVEASAALLFDWESAWAMQDPTMPSNDLQPMDTIRAAHRALGRLGTTADVVHPDRDLAGYRLLVVPSLYLCDDALAARLEGYARAGAEVVVTFFSGIADRDDRVRTGGYPGAFRGLLGVRSDAFTPLLPGIVVRAGGSDVGELAARTWTEEVEVRDAVVVARYDDGPWPGAAVLTRRAVGRGGAWYLASQLDVAGWRAVLARVGAELDARTPVPELSPRDGLLTDEVVEAIARGDLELVRRTGSGRAWTFALNHGTDPVRVRLPGEDLLTGRCAQVVELGAGGAAVVRAEVAGAV